MVRVKHPLWSGAASGRIGEIGYFTTVSGTPTLAKLPRKVETVSPEQARWRCLFKRAHAEWRELRTGPGERDVPEWPEFWREWARAHREDPCPGQPDPPPPPPEGWVLDGSVPLDGSEVLGPW